MTFKWFVAASAMLVGFGVVTAHAQTATQQKAPGRDQAPSTTAKPATAAATPAARSPAAGAFMPNPEVAVTVVDVKSYRVSVLGEVQTPGVLQLKADTTVLEAIALSGGFRDFASPGKIMILRKDATGTTHKIPFNYNRVVKDNRSQDNVTLTSGDVVVVP